MTNDRMEMLAQYLNDHPAEMEELLGLSADHAAKRMNESGYDFTADELTAFAETMQTMFAEENMELGEDDLTCVAGGAQKSYSDRLREAWDNAVKRERKWRANSKCPFLRWTARS